MNAHFQKVLEVIREDLEQAWGVTVVAEHEEPTGDALDLFLTGMADGIRRTFGESAQSAVDLIFRGIEEMAGDGLISEMPSSGAERALSEWLSEAHEAGLRGYVMRLAKDKA